MLCYDGHALLGRTCIASDRKISLGVETVAGYPLDAKPVTENDMTTCPECGASVNPSRFCSECGSPLNAFTTPTAPAEQQDENVERRMSLRPRVALAVVILCGLILVAYVIVDVIERYSSSDSTSQSDNSNADPGQWNDAPVDSPMDNTRTIKITNTASDGATQITANPILTVTCLSPNNFDVNINVGVGGGRGRCCYT